MQKIQVFSILAGFAIVLALLTPLAYAASPASGEHVSSPSDRSIPQYQMPSPVRPTGPGVRPGCALDSSMFTGRNSTPVTPDRPSVGSFTCSV